MQEQNSNVAGQFMVNLNRFGFVQGNVAYEGAAAQFGSPEPAPPAEEASAEDWLHWASIMG